jgi:toxin CptA
MVRASLAPSLRIAVVLVIAHIAAAGAVAPLDMPLALKAALIGAVAASLARSFCRHALLKATRSVLALEVKDQETACVQGPDRIWRDARILGTSYVSAALTVLSVRVAGERLPRHVLLIRGNVDEQEFRRVRVLLRWRRRAVADARGANAVPE